MRFGVSNKTNSVVDRIANQANISIPNLNLGGYNSNPISVANHINQIGDNTSKVGDIVQQIAKQQEPSGPSSAPQGGGGFLKTALTTGALAIGMAVAPGVASVAAVAVSLGESAHFGLKGNAGKGEMTLANSSAAEAFENGVYVSAFDGQSTNIMTGQSIAKSTPLGQPAGAPARGVHNMGQIVAEQTAGMSEKEIYESVVYKFKENQKALGFDIAALDKMGVKGIDNPLNVFAENHLDTLGEGAKLPTPKPVAAMFVPKGLNFG